MGAAAAEQASTAGAKASKGAVKLVTPRGKAAARAVAALRRPGARPDRARPRPRAGAALPGAPGIRGVRLHEAAADDLRAPRPARPARRAAARARARLRSHGDEQPRPRRLPADHAPARGQVVARVRAARGAVRRGVLVVRPLREDRVDRALLELRLSPHARASTSGSASSCARPPAIAAPPPSRRRCRWSRDRTTRHRRRRAPLPARFPGDPQRDPGAKPTRRRPPRRCRCRSRPRPAPPRRSRRRRRSPSDTAPRGTRLPSWPRWTARSPGAPALLMALAVAVIAVVLGVDARRVVLPLVGLARRPGRVGRVRAARRGACCELPAGWTLLGAALSGLPEPRRGARRRPLGRARRSR